MGYSLNKGFTFIETVMAILIISVISLSGSLIMAPLLRNSVFIPNQLNMDMLGQEALDIMIEGDAGAKGLRFSKQIRGVAANQVDFVNQDSKNIYYRLDTNRNKLYRSISGGPESPVPYYAVSGINISGKNNALFTYYDSTNAVTNNPANVRRIQIVLIARTGSGSYADWQGRSEQSSSIKVSKFQ